MGFDSNRFQEEVDEELVCTICSAVLEDPLQVPICEHAFCRGCITEWINVQSTCPVDRADITISKLCPVPRILTNFLAKLRINCDNAAYGCETTPNLESLQSHLVECEYNPKKSVSCDQGCGLIIPRENLIDHNCMREMRSLIQSQDAKLQSQNSKLQSQDTKLQSQDAKLESQETKLQLQEAKLESQDTKLQSQDAKLQSQDAKLWSQEAMLQSQDAKLQSQDAKLQSQDTQLWSQEAKLQSQEAKLQSQDAKLQSQEVKLQSQDTQLWSQDAKLQSQDAKLQSQEAKLQLQDATLQSQDTKLKEYHQELGEVRLIINEHKREIALLKPQGEKILRGGVRIQELKVGNGAQAVTGESVEVCCEGRLQSNNRHFMNWRDCNFLLGADTFFKGWHVGVPGMKVGGKRKITCPPNMAYGIKDCPPDVPPNSTIVFEVELMKVNSNI